MKSVSRVGFSHGHHRLAQKQSGTPDAAGKARRVPRSGASPMGSTLSVGRALGSGALGVRASGPRAGLRSAEQGTGERPARLQGAGLGWGGL